MVFASFLPNNWAGISPSVNQGSMGGTLFVVAPFLIPQPGTIFATYDKFFLSNRGSFCGKKLPKTKIAKPK